MDMGLSSYLSDGEFSAPGDARGRYARVVPSRRELHHALGDERHDRVGAFREGRAGARGDGGGRSLRIGSPRRESAK